MDFLRKTYNEETVTKSIEKSIAWRKLSIELADWILEYAENHKGKKITKRIANDMRKAWPNLLILWEKSTYSRDLTVYSDSANEFASIYLSFWQDEDNIIPDLWRKKLNCYFMGHEIIPKQLEGLNHVKELIERMKIAQDQVKQIMEEAKAFEIRHLLNN